LSVVAAKLLLASTHYALLAIFAFSCWGLGRILLRDRSSTRALPAPLVEPMAVALGIGICICVLQALAVAGLLTKLPTLGLLGSGWILGAIAVITRARAGTLRFTPGASWKARTRSEKTLLIALVLAALPTLFAPLSPPIAWDELMYHLPHAAQWASTGRLQVNEWLRYPWFPYNYDLLYAAALLFGSDVFPHLLHALAGWLTAWLGYRLGVLHLDRVTAAVAALLWLSLSKSQYANAYIDMGVTLFILVACVAMQQWRESDNRAWVAICAFSLGVAAGSKYQVLALLPFFIVVLAWRDRRPTNWLVAAGAFAVPCVYWYARNAIATGDPFTPVGGRVFGFTDWNLADYQGQFEDLRRHAGWPHWALWGALIVPFVPTLRQRRAVQGALVLAAYMLLVWTASSPYPRYLMHAYPLLALLSAAGAVHVARSIGQRLPGLGTPAATRWAPRILLGALCVTSFVASHKLWLRIAPTHESRDALLTRNVTGYAMWAHLRAHPVGKLYQLGLEGSLYYAPSPVWGDIFGPWRYRDVVDLAPAELHRKLAAQNFDALVIDTQRMPQVTAKPGFGAYFTLLHSEDSIRLYRLTPKDPP
jgi:hypothetical protein